MRLNQLEYFIKVVECGSITKAAQEMYLSQPSLTKAVSGLEAEYDLKLFDRTAKGLKLTPEGRDFLEYAKSVVESSQALDRTFGNKQNNFSIQRLAVASQQFDFIYDILLLLYKENSDQLLQIDLKENDRGEIVEMVEECKADIGILVLSEEDSKSFRSELQSKDLVQPEGSECGGSGKISPYLSGYRPDHAQRDALPERMGRRCQPRTCDLLQYGRRLP